MSVLNIVQCSPETLDMQTLIIQVATTFVEDTAALVNGFGRIVTHIVMAPIDRIANACDVAGLLAMRAAQAKKHTQTGIVLRSFGTRRRARRSPRRGGCLRFLGDLT
jgi:hypothetical protein